MQQSLPNKISSQRRRLTASWVMPGLLLGQIISLAAPTIADDGPALSAPVRILGSARPAMPMAPMMVVREAPPQATPGARMPQYQLHHPDRIESDDATSPNLRFILALSGRPVLIEATITIDGTPFRQQREQRVQEILKYIADPEAFKAEAAEAEAAAIAAMSASETGILDTIIDLVSQFTPTIENETPTVLESGTTPTDGDETAIESTPKAADALEESSTPGEPVSDSPATEDLKPTEPEVPAVPPYTAPSTIFERIDRYTKSTGQKPDADEIRWLLTNWIDGPVLLYLNDNFQRFRADQQPVFRILDRDRDGRVSADELKQAVVSFQECDLDRNDIVDATELAEVANNPRNQPVHVAHSKLIFRLPEETTASLTFRRLAAIYADAAASTPTSLRFDKNQDGLCDSDELKQLTDGEADIRLRIDFHTTAPDTSRLSIIGFSPEFADSKYSATINADSVTLALAELDLEFTAAQGNADDQVSVGAVDDGYAMLPELDPNGDGRFTIRELRQLNERLGAFDRNADGEITRDEMHPTIRVCIGLGPIAHQPLVLLRSSKTSVAPSLTGPEWFHQMDKNRDNDISRKEFPGTDDQFVQLDSDDDGLISVVEASESEKQ